MDSTTERLVDFAMQSEYKDLTPDVVHECKRRLIDTFACAVGAYHEPISMMARDMAKRYKGEPAASVWGSVPATTPEAAAFANGVMLRLEDISDNYRVKSGGHPSDVIAGLMACAETVNASGAELINAITIAYDVYCGLLESYDINSKGWDQPIYGVVACALGAGKLLGLNREQMGNALALALVPNMALFQTRAGDLSSWKGCAGGNASRNALFAAFLARDGFTGPTAPFDGPHGMFDIVGRFDWKVEVDPGDTHRVAKTHFKSFPVCGHGQSATQAAVELHPRLKNAKIASVTAEVYAMAVEMMANDGSRWAPKTRETADHSLPFVVSVALMDGAVVSSSFSAQRLTDPATVALMQKVKVVADPEISARFPEAWSSRVRVRLESGEELVQEVYYPKGHTKDPFSDADLETKFRNMFREYGDAAQCQAVLDALWKFEKAERASDVLKLLLVKH